MPWAALAPYKDLLQGAFRTQVNCNLNGSTFLSVLAEDFKFWSCPKLSNVVKNEWPSSQKAFNLKVSTWNFKIVKLSATFVWRTHQLFWIQTNFLNWAILNLSTNKLKIFWTNVLAPLIMNGFPLEQIKSGELLGINSARWKAKLQDGNRWLSMIEILNDFQTPSNRLHRLNTISGYRSCLIYF